MEYIGLGWRKQDGAWTAVRATEDRLAAIGAAPAATATQPDTENARTDAAQEPGSTSLAAPAAPVAPMPPIAAR